MIGFNIKHYSALSLVVYALYISYDGFLMLLLQSEFKLDAKVLLLKNVFLI